MPYHIHMNISHVRSREMKCLIQNKIIKMNGHDIYFIACMKGEMNLSSTKDESEGMRPKKI